MSIYAKAVFYIAAPILVMLAVYGVFAFVLWELNAGQWGIDARSMFALFGVTLSLSSLFVVFSIFKGDI